MTGLYMFGLESGGGERVVPTVTLVSPVAEGAIDQETPIVFDIEDNRALSVLRVDVNLTGEDTWEGVYRNGGFSVRYASGSSVDVLEVGKRYRFTVFRPGGWPKNFSLDVTATDAAGNVAA